MGPILGPGAAAAACGARRLLALRAPAHPPLVPTASLASDAKDLRSQGKLKLPQLMADFRLVGKAYAAAHAGAPAAGAAFFAHMEFSRAKDLFGRMGVQALPWLGRVPPGLAISEGGAIKLEADDMMPGSTYPWSLDALASWVGERSGHPVGEVKRAPLISPR